jgi:hypothetical protein
MVYLAQSLNFRRLRMMGNSSVSTLLQEVDSLIASGRLRELPAMIPAVTPTSYLGHHDTRRAYILRAKHAEARGRFSEVVEWYTAADRVAKTLTKDENSEGALEVAFLLIRAYAMQGDLFWQIRVIGLVRRIREHNLFESRRKEVNRILLTGSRACKRIAQQPAVA